MKKYGKLLAAALALSALALYACGTPPEPGPTLSPAYAKIAVGQMVQFSVPDSSQVRSEVEWSTGDPEVAEVSSDGWVTGLKQGRSIISGRCKISGYCPTALVVVVNETGPQDPDPKSGER